MFVFVVEQCEANTVLPTLQIRSENMTATFAPICGLPKQHNIDPTAERGSISFPTWDGRVYLRWDSKTVCVENAPLPGMVNGTTQIKVIKSDTSFETSLQAWIDYEHEIDMSVSQRTQTGDSQAKKRKQ